MIVMLSALPDLIQTALTIIFCLLHTGPCSNAWKYCSTSRGMRLAMLSVNKNCQNLSRLTILSVPERVLAPTLKSSFTTGILSSKAVDVTL